MGVAYWRMSIFRYSAVANYVGSSDDCAVPKTQMCDALNLLESCRLVAETIVVSQNLPAHSTEN